MTVLATIIVLLTGGAALATWLPRILDRLLSSRNAEVDSRLRAMNDKMTFLATTSKF